jgi:hypothetical protein
MSFVEAIRDMMDVGFEREVRKYTAEKGYLRVTLKVLERNCACA